MKYRIVIEGYADLRRAEKLRKLGGRWARFLGRMSGVVVTNHTTVTADGQDGA